MNPPINPEPLLKFAQLVSDFFDRDSAGHSQYLKGQADLAVQKALEGVPLAEVKP